MLKLMCKKIIKKITQIKFPYLDLCILSLYFLTPGIRTCGMCESRKFCQRGPTLTTLFFFLVDGMERGSKSH